MWWLLRPGYIGPNLPSYRATPLRLIRKLKRFKPSTEPPTQTRGKVACTCLHSKRRTQAAWGYLSWYVNTKQEIYPSGKKHGLMENSQFSSMIFLSTLIFLRDDSHLSTMFPWSSYDFPCSYICKPSFLSEIFQAPGWHRRYLAPRRCAELVCCEPGWIAGVPPPCCEAPDGITTL